MQKQCQCGELMKIKLRTVIYSGKVEIDNVPIYSCSTCSKSEVFPEVKSDLTGLISQLGDKPERQTLLFNECNEWANVLVEAKSTTKQSGVDSVEQLVERHINKLLDLYLLARSLQDEEWISDINKRLEQLSRHTLHT